MNIRELDEGVYGTLLHYVEAALPLTVVTIWIVVAFQSHYVANDPDASMLRRLLWPSECIISRLLTCV